jgi:hypothetical protein
VSTRIRIRAAVFYFGMVFLSDGASAACNGRTATRTGPTGITLDVCLDGKYTTCVRDSQRLGWPMDSTLRFCDDKRAKGGVK